MRFTDLRIGVRLALVLSGVLITTAAVAVSGMWGLGVLFTTSRQVVTQDLALAQSAGEAQNLILQMRRFEKDAFINLADASSRDAYVKKWTQAREQLDRTIAQTQRLKLTDDDAKALARMSADLKSYASGLESTLAGIRSSQITSTQDANKDIGKAKAFTHGMETASDTVAAHAQERATQAMAVIESVRDRAVTLQATLALAGIVLACVCCWAVTRSITVPIRQAVEMAEVVASGDLRMRITSDRRDEPGQLLAALARMNLSLVDIVGQVRQSSDSIATGSAQIATGNADLSQRTEAQASNLQETASAMEQITGTVGQNAETARRASALVEQACDAAGQGGKVVGGVVSTMADISASSKRIADIIGVIDGIAFQTNILALNAAVEAARAGEHGRGFAVVASEVRGLAQRSATAAREIKSLINESVEKVESGSRLVDEAGQSMDGIVSQVQSISALINEISHASAEQSTGIGQIGVAVSQLDHMTQQNAALVEESAAAAASLNQQAARLAETVALFQV